jgi:sugar/nucleoside kinase (ribokinase family)
MSDLNDIVAVGSIAFDSIETPKGKRNHILGGSSTYFGVAASLFSKVNLIGIVGDDFSNNEWALFEKYNIDTSSIEIARGNTFSWSGKYNQDYSSRETLFTNLGVFENFKPKINSMYENPILYLGNIQPQLQFDVINKIKDPLLIAADSMNLWIDLYPEEVWKLITKVNIFMLNDEEAFQLTGEKNLENVITQFLSLGPKIVIIKMGGKGCLVAHNNKIEHISIVPDTPVLDPTGAGDSFAGGLLGYIAKYGPSNPVKAAAYGSAVASFTVSGFGLENLINMNKDNLAAKIEKIIIS